jgi:CRP/FNR family transcriptional regulator
MRMPPFDMGRMREKTMTAPEMNPCGACPVRPLTVCAALDPEELRRLADIVQMQRVEASQTIFGEGDPAEALFNVTAGTVKLYKLLPDGRRQITGFLVTGDFLGLAMNDSYAYSAETVTATSLCRFPRRKMEALLDEFPKMQRRLFSMASNELAAADIADYLGLTTETVSRTFTQLKTAGAISLQEGNRIMIADMDAIFDMAEGV